MPSGYTQKILNGASFREFALSCARAFGANIMMKDDHPDTPIQVYEVDPYYPQKFAEVKKRLERVATMTLREAGIAAETEYREAMYAHEEIIKERRASRDKYVAMLAEVEKWQPPTPDHAALKKYMKDQITDSIDADCDTSMSYYDPPKKLTASKWLEKERAEAERDLEYYGKRLREEEQRVSNSNEWNAALMESL